MDSAARMGLWRHPRVPRMDGDSPTQRCLGIEKEGRAEELWVSAGPPLWPVRRGQCSRGSVTPQGLWLASVRLLPAVWERHSEWSVAVTASVLLDSPVLTASGFLPSPGKPYALHPVCVVVLAVLVALVLALATAVAALSAGRRGGDAVVPVALVLGCPEDWVGYRGACYYFSKEEGSWEWSREQCSLHGAWLAVLRRECEMEFLWHLKGNVDYWIGLQRRGERLEWVDGSSFNQTLVVHGQEVCVYLNDGVIASSRCSQQRPYLCSKPQALMGTG